MRKRLIVTLGVLLAFVAGLGAVKFFQIRAAIAQGASWQPPPEAVTTVVVQQEEWPLSLSAIGSVAAHQGVTVSADLPGIVERITFTSGSTVRAGDVLVTLDASQERAQLAAAEAQNELARQNLERSKALLERQVISQADHDRMSAEAKQAEARVGEIQATIERKRIRAPFTGRLGIRQVNLGQYLNAGDPVVPLQSMDPVFVNFSLPQQDIGALKVGEVVRASSDSLDLGAAEGRITAINSIVDPSTRNIDVQATFRNPRATLRPGMFVDVEIVLGGTQDVIALPASAISYAPYGNSVFVVGEMKTDKGQKYLGVRQQFVKTGRGRGDQIAVLGGLKPGEQVVSSGVFKLRNGASIHVNNEQRPANDPAPEPEDS